VNAYYFEVLQVQHACKLHVKTFYPHILKQQPNQEESLPKSTAALEVSY